MYSIQAQALLFLLFINAYLNRPSFSSSGTALVKLCNKRRRLELNWVEEGDVEKANGRIPFSDCMYLPWHNMHRTTDKCQSGRLLGEGRFCSG